MIWILAKMDRDEALARGYWSLSMILLVGLLAVLFFVAMFMLRRWKRRQLKAIELDRAERRAGQSAGRVDAWQASSDRYIDHDKLSEDDELFSRDDETDSEEDPPGDEADPQEEDRDPYGLFSDKPYEDAEDDDYGEENDEDDEDEDGDWDEDDEPDGRR